LASLDAFICARLQDHVQKIPLLPLDTPSDLVGRGQISVYLDAVLRSNTLSELEEAGKTFDTHRSRMVQLRECVAEAAKLLKARVARAVKDAEAAKGEAAKKAAAEQSQRERQAANSLKNQALRAKLVTEGVFSVEWDKIVEYASVEEMSGKTENEIVKGPYIIKDVAVAKEVMAHTDVIRS